MAPKLNKKLLELSFQRVFTPHLWGEDLRMGRDGKEDRREDLTVHCLVAQSQNVFRAAQNLTRGGWVCPLCSSASEFVETGFVNC